MLVSKTFLVFLLCFVHGCISKPATGNEITEGRGVMSSIWGWIKYPFSWWYSGETEQPVTEPLLASTTNDPNYIVDIRSHNVTIWCNDQTCNTMKCNKTQCKNITCSIYDTDFRGECREYNLLSDSDELTVSKSTKATPKEYFTSKPTETFNTTTTVATTTEDKEHNLQMDERPLVLEKLMSSTVNNHNSDSEIIENPTSHKSEV